MAGDEPGRQHVEPVEEREGRRGVEEWSGEEHPPSVTFRRHDNDGDSLDYTHLNLSTASRSGGSSPGTSDPSPSCIFDKSNH